MTDHAAPVPPVRRGTSLGDKIEEIRAKWGWFVALGIATLLIGLFALYNVVAAAVAGAWVFGMLMTVAGAMQIFHAFQVRGWGSFVFWLLAGVIYLAAGVVSFTSPLFTSILLTVMLAASLVVAGLLRLIVGFQMRPGVGWGWMALAGAITLVFGLVVTALIIGWPASGIVFFGTLVAVDLIFQGVSNIAFGLALKAKRVP